MNKNIKRIIALALTVNAFCTVSAVTPGISLDITTKAAYADSYSPSTGELKTLKIKSTNGDTLDLRGGFNGDKVKLSDDKTYYTKLTDDSEGVKIDADVKGEDYIVRIFTSDGADAAAIKTGEEIPLGKGDDTLYVRTYESLSDFRKAKDDKKDVRICKEEYKINVRKTKGSANEDSNQASIYLSKLELSKGDLTFVKQKTSYDVKVASDIDEIKITAKPEDTNNRVRINGDQVYANDDYKKTVYLDKGKNKIEVKITNDKDEQRIYTLNVVRGKDDGQDNVYLDDLTLSEGSIDFSKDDSTYNVDLDESVDEVKIGAPPEDEGYVVTIGGKEVNSDDDFKKKVSLDKGKNTVEVVVKDEVNDKKRTYTLTINRGKEDNKTTDNNSTNTNNNQTNTTQTDNKTPGWVQASTGWQYNDKNGNKMTGWVEDGENWFYMDTNGAMQSGWVTINNVKYYLNPNSDGTKGAMKTGWQKVDEAWYYLNPVSNGTKGAVKVGWLKDGEKWYYLNKDGVMQTGWIEDSKSKYYLDASGVMVTGNKTIDNKEYKFAANGTLMS